MLLLLLLFSSFILSLLSRVFSIRPHLFPFPLPFSHVSLPPPLLSICFLFPSLSLLNFYFLFSALLFVIAFPFHSSLLPLYSHSILPFSSFLIFRCLPPPFLLSYFPFERPTSLLTSRFSNPFSLSNSFSNSPLPFLFPILSHPSLFALSSLLFPF